MKKGNNQNIQKQGAEVRAKRTQVKHRGCHKNGIITAALCWSPPNLPNEKNVAEEWTDFVFLDICLDCERLAAPCCQQSERLGVLERCGVYL